MDLGCGQSVLESDLLRMDVALDHKKKSRNHGTLPSLLSGEVELIYASNQEQDLKVRILNQVHMLGENTE